MGQSAHLCKKERNQNHIGKVIEFLRNLLPGIILVLLIGYAKPCRSYVGHNGVQRLAAVSRLPETIQPDFDDWLQTTYGASPHIAPPKPQRFGVPPYHPKGQWRTSMNPAFARCDQAGDGVARQLFSDSLTQSAEPLAAICFGRVFAWKGETEKRDRAEINSVRLKPAISAALL